MDDDVRFRGPVRALLSRVERLGSVPALGDMTDGELELWQQTCAAMIARPVRASSAQRTWRQLLDEARGERAVRDGQQRRPG